MDNLFALGALILLVARLLPYALAYMSPRMARRIFAQLQRFQALLDIGIGTLMVILVVLLLIQRSWILAGALAIISFPTFRGLITGFRTLVRLQQ